jgi:hypothetical protein
MGGVGVLGEGNQEDTEFSDGKWKVEKQRALCEDVEMIFFMLSFLFLIRITATAECKLI